jgi:hypothetical protein
MEGRCQCLYEGAIERGRKRGGREVERTIMNWEYGGGRAGGQGQASSKVREWGRRDAECRRSELGRRWVGETVKE